MQTSSKREKKGRKEVDTAFSLKPSAPPTVDIRHMRAEHMHYIRISAHDPPGGGLSYPNPKWSPRRTKAACGSYPSFSCFYSSWLCAWLASNFPGSDPSSHRSCISRRRQIKMNGYTTVNNETQDPDWRDRQHKPRMRQTHCAIKTV